MIDDMMMTTKKICLIWLDICLHDTSIPHLLKGVTILRLVPFSTRSIWLCMSYRNTQWRAGYESGH